MSIPRLEPTASPYELTATINVNLRPYFEVWYQNAKEVAETPEQFAIRILKNAALNYHIGANIKIEQDAIEQAKVDAQTAVNADLTSLTTEVD